MHVFSSYYSHYLKNIRNGTENMERLSGKGTVYCCYKAIIKSSLKKFKIQGSDCTNKLAFYSDISRDLLQS